MCEMVDVRLVTPRVEVVNGNSVGQAPGQIVSVDAATAAKMLNAGQATPAGEPEQPVARSEKPRKKPAKKKGSK